MTRVDWWLLFLIVLVEIQMVSGQRWLGRQFTLMRAKHSVLVEEIRQILKEKK